METTETAAPRPAGAHRGLDSAHGWTAYAVALVAVVVAVAGRLALEPLLSGRNWSTTLFIAIAVSAWFGGLRPGLFATAAGGVVVFLFAIDPRGTLGVTEPRDLLALGLFLFGGTTISVIGALAEAARRRAERHALRATRLQAVNEAVARQLTPTEVADTVLREGLAAFGAGTGVMGVVDPSGRTVEILAAHGYGEALVDRWTEFPVDGDYPLCEVVRTHEVLVFPDVASVRARYPHMRIELPEADGPSVVVPLLYEDRALGGMYWHFADQRTLDDADRVDLVAIGRRAAAALIRARLYHEQMQSAARAAFLARTSEALAASLDEQRTVRRVARLAAAELADWSAVHLLGHDDAIELMTVRHRDPARIRSAQRLLETSGPRYTDAAGVGAVIRTGKTEQVEAVSHDRLLALARGDRERLALLEEVGPYAHIIVPLVARRDRVLGALTLAMSDSRRRFNPQDFGIAEELGRRVGVAIENARLYRQLRAREAQQSAVARIGQRAIEESELGPLFEVVGQELRDTLGVEFVEILERLPNGDELLLVGGAGWRPGQIGTTRLSAGTGSQAGYTLVARGPVVVADLYTETRFQSSPLLREHGVVSGMSVLVGSADEPWGVLGVQSTRSRAFSEDDIDFLTAVANVLAGAIERRRDLDRERAAQEVGRAFIGVVNHELRTPITTIYAGAKLLRRAGRNDPQREELAADVESEAERLYRLTEDLLVLTRLERRDLEIALEPVLVRHIVSRAVEAERRRWPLVDFRITADPQLGAASGEDSYIEQILRNLLTNAAKYSPSPSVIDVRVEDAGPEIIVRVLDRGPGIGSGDPEELFGLFYRSPTTAQQASGAGIGLFVCQRLLAAMGGRLWAGNRPDGGSEFGFALQRYRGEDDLEFDDDVAAPIALPDVDGGSAEPDELPSAGITAEAARPG